MTQQALLTLLALLLIPAVAHADDAQKAAARMAQEHQHDKPAPTPAATQEPARPVSAEEVAYATVIYYGHLETDPAKLGILKSPVIGFFGAEDKSIPVDGVHAFEAELKKQGKPVEVHVYDGAGHAFANPSGGSYRPEAARDAWTRTTAFFAKHLKGNDAGKG